MNPIIDVLMKMMKPIGIHDDMVISHQRLPKVPQFLKTLINRHV